jgi:2-C-methyl-D-erythritol 4-phosphate cytidylyltransferase
MKVEAPKHIAVVLFGGVGTRYAGKLPKQFAIVGDRPLMCYALRALNESPDVDEILVVAPVAYSKATQDIIHDYRYRKVDAVIDGGKEREDSVFNALAYLYQKGVEPKDIVLICDGDRPNLTPELIKANIEAAIQYGAAVTAIPATDSIIYSEGGKFRRTIPAPQGRLSRPDSPNFPVFAHLQRPPESETPSETHLHRRRFHRRLLP